MKEFNLEIYDRPHNLFAEKFVLGSILIHPEAIVIVSQRLNVESFYIESHQIIYKGALILYGENKKIDFITLTTWLQDQNYSNCIDEISKIASFFTQIFVVSSLEDYVALVYEKYLRRCLIELGSDILNLSYMGNYSIENLFSIIQKKFSILTEKRQTENFNSAAEILTQVIDEIKQNLQGSHTVSLTSSFPNLDIITQGFYPSDLVILAGRPSMGKTAFSLNLAKNISIKHNVSVVFFSLEMTRQQLMYRLLSTETHINNARLRSGLVTKTEWIQINQAVENLSNLKLYIDDSPNIKVNEIRLKVNKLEQEYQEKFSLIIVDYLQLLEGSIKLENRTQELSKITRQLKKLARDLNIPIIVLSQLSRNVETRVNKRPLLSDLRESGCFTFTSKSGKKILANNKVQKTNNVLTISWTGKKLIKKSIGAIKTTGQKPIYKLNTSLGWSILASGNHKLYTKNGWKRIDQLRKNDLICNKLLLSIFNINLTRKNSLNWEKITRVSYTNIGFVYDIEIPFLSNYLFNRFITHNSIEQDADVVMMLYRDEYYHPNTNEKNIVEIILSKHRHGPLGTAKLNFDAKHLRFF